ncbi:MULTISPECIES: DUF4407 domain-containing protein [Thiorhodovibrio]|uniref:DUF4407 domain-containing protein n=1 Tax=Thiorhodovibrio TaxID=61593 RepID=UPI00191127D5|nr:MULTISPECIES: DUF4407 domain-containing protein [Thiorhodovibrio]MBK5968906.1 hypothetical protein [Thiorhodovibrio winogradskyi]WPL12720.1 chromosome segregation protein SMC [Thiorhodovibrio litoralis]
MRLIDYLRLRPYGDSLLTPAAAAWIGSARVLVFLMASIEGFVWGAVGLSMVPTETAWLGPPVGLFLFALMFAVIWILDASLVMSEKPSLNTQPSNKGLAAKGRVLRWLLGLLVRVAIVAISLYVTAPFVEKLIRADDIAAWHQAQVERYFDQRARDLNEQVEARAARQGAGYNARAQDLERQIGVLQQTIEGERERREQLTAEYRPELQVLTQDLAEARQRVGDEVLGRDGRREGFGPEAQKWTDRADQLAETLAGKRAELSERIAPIEARINDEQERLDRLNDALTELRTEQQGLLAGIAAEVEAEQPPAAPPALTFAVRSKALNALRESPAEQGVPHFETVEGFAQAALGILFFALIALKLFEPPAVQAYYSDTIQDQYPKYLAGGLEDIPGFDQYDDPARRLTPGEFARRWRQWQRDPEAMVTESRAEIEARRRLARMNADQTYEGELLSRRRENIDGQLALELRQRESEFAARERELELRLEKLRARLGDEAELERQRDRLQLTQEQEQRAAAKAKAEQEQREQQIQSLEREREQLRAELDAQQERQLDLARELAATERAISASKQSIQSLEAAVSAKEPRLQRLREDLAALEHERTASGATGRFGRLGRRAARMQAAIRRLERSLAPDQKALMDQRGQLGVLELGAEQLDRALEDGRAIELTLRQRLESQRAALDRLLLSPLPATESNTRIRQRGTSISARLKPP